MSGDERCERTDLIVEFCAHCLGHKLERPAIYRTGRSFEARYSGRCAICEGLITTGDQITRVQDGDGPVEGYAHAQCDR